jgi:hypothetical protein
MPIDQFADFAMSLTSPVTKLENITPSDSTDVLAVTRAINVAVAGVVRVTLASGQTGDVYVGAGTIFPARVTRVWATGTSASGIAGLS